MSKKFVITLMLFVVALSLYSLNQNVIHDDSFGTFYAEGEFGTVTLVVDKDDDMVEYYFDFKEHYLDLILEAEIFNLKFVANNEFQVQHLTAELSEGSDLLNRGVFRANVAKPFTKMEISIGLYVESVEFDKIK